VNAVAWIIQHSGKRGVRWVWALHGTTTLVISDTKPDVGKVWQHPYRTLIEAEVACIERVKNAEETGAYLPREPLFLDLPPEAVAEIHGVPGGGWVDSPHLFEALSKYL